MTIFVDFVVKIIIFAKFDVFDDFPLKTDIFWRFPKFLAKNVKNKPFYKLLFEVSSDVNFGKKWQKWDFN